MDTIDDKFKRFLAMTDRPEDFSDEELMELARDPEMAAWYAALSDAEKAAKRMTEATKLDGSRPRALIITLLATAAMLTVAFLLWPDAAHEEPPALITHEMPKLPRDEKEEQPVMVQPAKEEHPVTVTKKEKTVSHQGEAKPLEEKIVGLTIVPTSADLGPGVKMRLGKPCLTNEEADPLPEEDDSPIPTDKQALADMYLAEVALQVIYKQQEQVEAVRAYVTSLEDEEIPPAQPVIAF